MKATRLFIFSENVMSTGQAVNNSNFQKEAGMNKQYISFTFLVAAIITLLAACGEVFLAFIV